MKILYIAHKYEYNNPDRGFSFEHYNFYDSLLKMDKGIHQIIYFPFDEIMINMGRNEMNKKLIEAAYREKPNLCFFCLRRDEIKKETIREITNKSGAITFNWFNDDHWKFDNFSKYWAPCFNWIATTDYRAVKRYNKMGYKNVIKTQWACNHFFCQPLNLPKIYNISFIGQPHGNRKKIINNLKRIGIDVECWGWGWSKGKISQREMVKIFSQSKINLAFINSSSLNTLKSFAAIFLRRESDKTIKLNRPDCWLDNLKSVIKRRNAKQLKGRNFDVPGCRSFLLTDATDDLENYYQDGKEIVIYRDLKDLIKKIKYYLEHDKERENIAKAGYERTLREHTYEKRFQEIFNIIKK